METTIVGVYKYWGYIVPQSSGCQRLVAIEQEPSEDRPLQGLKNTGGIWDNGKETWKRKMESIGGIGTM